MDGAGLLQHSMQDFSDGSEDLFLSLLCAFGDWYNSSGQAEHVSRLSAASNASHTPVELFAHEWLIFLPPGHMRALQICPILGCLAVLLATPVILGCILRSSDLRQQSRYLLLANALLSDLLFLSAYMLSTSLNAAGVLMSQWACATLLFLMGALYSAGVLSTKAMVLDTTLAVLLPLRYLALWPVSRTRRVIGAIWATAVLLPTASVGGFIWYHSTGPCKHHICSLPLLVVLTVSHSRPLWVSMLLTVTVVLVILMLVFVGYVVLCCRTKEAGVWRGEQSSRAKGTFLIHYLNLFLTVCPMLVLVIELLTYCHHSEPDLRVNLWVCFVVCNVLLVLPKALAPYMYGLRYRDLCGELFKIFGLKRPAAVCPLT